MQPTPMNRRNWLKTAAAVSAQSTLMTLLQSCADNSSQASATVNDDLHIHIPASLHGTSLLVHIAGTRYALRAHTDDTRALARTQNPALQGVQDARLTHYLQDAPFAANTQSFRLLSIDAQGQVSFVGGGIHLPPTPASTAAFDYDRKLLGQTASDGHVAQITDAVDSAIWHVFHHPKLMSLDVQISQQVLAHIKASGSFQSLVALIDANPAKSAQAYVISELVRDDSGQPMVCTNSQGQPLRNPDGSLRLLYSINLSPSAQKLVNQVVSQTTILIKGDDAFADIKHSTQINPGNPSTNSAAQARGLRLAKEEPEFALEGDGRFIHDVKLEVENYDPAQRELRLSVENRRFEHVALYASYEDANGDLQLLSTLGIDKRFTDSDRMQLLHLVDPYETFFAVPTEPGEASVRLKVPEQSTGVRLWITKFGFQNGPDYLPELSSSVCLAPTFFTFLFELAIPTILLASGGISLKKPTYQEFIKDSIKDLFKEAAINLVEGFLEALADTESSHLVEKFMGILMDTLVKICPVFIAHLSVLVAKLEGIALAEECIPIAGQIYLAASATASVAEILESLGSFVEGPRFSAQSLRITNTAELTCQADGFGFAPALSEARITVLLSGRTQPYAYTLPINTPSTNILKLSTGPFLAGPDATFEVALYSKATDEVLSRGQVKLQNPASPTAPLEGILEMQTKPASLSNTEPRPFVELAVTTGFPPPPPFVLPTLQLTWMPSTERAVSMPMCQQSSAAGVCQTFGISVSNGARRVGMTSLGTGPHSCNNSAQLNPALMTLALPVNPFDPADGGNGQLIFYDGGLVRGSAQPSEGGCQDRPMHLALDLVEGNDGNHFVLLPNVKTKGYNVRRLSLVPGATPTNLANAPLVGRFLSNKIKHVRWHPKGYLVAISGDAPCLEILSTTGSENPASTEENVARSIVGEGDSLLTNPVCIAPIRNASLFLVLDGNRILCMDDQGALVRFFNQEQSYLQYFDPSPQWMDVDVQGVLYTMGAGWGLNAVNLQTGSFYFNTNLGAINQFAVDYWRSIYTTESQAAGAWDGNRSAPKIRVWRPARS
jgi:hypothetical protein